MPNYEDRLKTTIKYTESLVDSVKGGSDIRAEFSVYKKELEKATDLTEAKVEKINEKLKGFAQTAIKEINTKGAVLK